MKGSVSFPRSCPGDTEGEIRSRIQTLRYIGSLQSPLASKSLQAEEHVGLMFPCNVAVQGGEGGKVVGS